MNKKEILKTLDLSSFIMLVISTIFVLIFEIGGNTIFVKMAIFIYAVAYLCLFVLLVLRLCFSKNAIKEEKTSEAEVNTNKNQNIKLIVGAVFSGILFLLTLIIAVLYI